MVERIKESLRILNVQTVTAKTMDETEQMSGILYLFASKFLKEPLLAEVRRMIRMTALGQGIYDEGWMEGKTEVVFSILSELGSIPEELAERVRNEQDMLTIKRWIRLALQSDSMEEFEEQIF